MFLRRRRPLHPSSSRGRPSPSAWRIRESHAASARTLTLPEREGEARNRWKGEPFRWPIVRLGVFRSGCALSPPYTYTRGSLSSLLAVSFYANSDCTAVMMAVSTIGQEKHSSDVFFALSFFASSNEVGIFIRKFVSGQFVAKYCSPSPSCVLASSRWAKRGRRRTRKVGRSRLSRTFWQTRGLGWAARTAATFCLWWLLDSSASSFS